MSAAPGAASGTSHRQPLTFVTLAGGASGSGNCWIARARALWALSEPLWTGGAVASAA